MFVCSYVCTCVCVCVHVYVYMCVHLSPGLQSFLFHLFAFIFSSFLCLFFSSGAITVGLQLSGQSCPILPFSTRRSLSSPSTGGEGEAFTLGIPVTVQLTWTDRMGGRPTFQGRRPKPMAATLSHTAYPRASNASPGTHHAARRLSGDWNLRGELRLWSQTSLGLCQHLPPATCVLVGILWPSLSSRFLCFAVDEAVCLTGLPMTIKRMMSAEIYKALI